MVRTILPLTTFFSTVQVAALLQSKEITAIETVRANSKALPKEITGSSKDRFSTKFFTMLKKLLIGKLPSAS